METIDYSEKVPGLFVVHEAVCKSEEEELVSFADTQTWSGLGTSPNPELKRRTQQYGHLFSYRYRKVLQEYGPFPDNCTFFVNRITENQWMLNTPNHLLINEYNAGQGIMPHIDAPALFGPVIISLSLLSDCIMTFTNQDQPIDILLPRRSLAILTLDARYKYKHSISKDLEETVDGVTIHRDRRVSFTFREIIAWEALK
ncbi:hypothetical protein EDC94DRAFT_661342 [Helicostylum pulchrum]|uniref:Fe2OG dioxygenase domain-containing protein n=1 Tax=Helicostylum pulchrum TaxID=562976 RepID=A0ABP9XP52_9FUNG|nr:hypothetical protein EDC94DRAFT_661342 [Helicostylum pulchrum]